MITIYQRYGVVELGGTVVLGLVHAVMAVSWLIPGVATGVYAPMPGRVSVVTTLDQYGPIWQVGFGVTAIALLASLASVRILIPAHAGGAGIMAIFTAALWFGWGFSDAKPSIITALCATTVLAWHIVLVATYSLARSLPVRAGGRRRVSEEGT